MTEDLRYEKPDKLSRTEIEAEFASDDPERIMHALISASYTEAPEYLEGWCYRFAIHPSAKARSGAATVLGSIGWLHGLTQLSQAIATLETLRDDEDAYVRTQAEDSLRLVLEFAGRRKELN